MSIAALAGDLKVFDVSQKYVQNASYNISGEENFFGSVTWSGDGKLLVATHADSSLQKVPIVKYNDRHLFSARYIDVPGIQSACFYTWTNRFVGLGCKNGDVCVWDLKDKRLSVEVDTLKTRSVDHITLSCNDFHMATGNTESSEIFLHGLRTNKLLSKLEIPHSKSTSSLHFSPCKKTYLAASSFENSVVVWDIAKSSAVFKSVRPSDGTCRSIAWSPINQSLLASASLSKFVRMYDTLSKEAVYELKVPEPLYSIEFLPNGDKIVTGSSTGSVAVYDLRNTGNVLHEFKSFTSPVLGLKMQPVPLSAYQDAFVNSPLTVEEDQADVSANVSVIDILSPISRDTPGNKSQLTRTTNDDSFLRIFTPDSAAGSNRKRRIVQFSPAIKEEDDSMLGDFSSPEVARSVHSTPTQGPHSGSGDPVPDSPCASEGRGDAPTLEPSLRDVMNELKSLRSEVSTLRQEMHSLHLDNNEKLLHIDERLTMQRVQSDIYFRAQEKESIGLADDVEGIAKEVTLNGQRLNWIKNMLDEFQMR